MISKYEMYDYWLNTPKEQVQPATAEEKEPSLDELIMQLIISV